MRWCRRQELRQLQDSREDLVSYLLACMAQARQEALAERERAALSAAPQQQQQQVAAPHLETMLQGALQRLGVDWQDREGLALASASSSVSVTSQSFSAAGGPRHIASIGGGGVSSSLLTATFMKPTPD